MNDTVKFDEFSNVGPDHADYIWSQVLPYMGPAVAKHGDPSSVDSQLEFHRQSLIAMLRAGYHTLRYIQVGDGVFPIASSAGHEEHWYSIGGLLNCSFEPPCTPLQFRAALAHVPALGDLHIHQRMFAACETVPYEDCSGRFKLHEQFDSYVAAAPKKVRSEWGRIMRKAHDNGISIPGVQTPLEVLAAARQLMPGYQDYWRDRHDGYSNECEMMEATLDTFAAADPRYWLGFAIYKDDRPVAVNLAWIKDDVVYDTICIREVSDELRPFSIGVLAVLFNIRLCTHWQESIEKRLTYSLAGGDQPYKKQFCYDSLPMVRVPVLSDIDVYEGHYPGYYNGQWVTEENNVVLNDHQIEYLHRTYPFTDPANAED